MKPRRIPYSAAEMAWLEANRTLVISDYHREFVAAFERGDVTAAHLHGLRKRMSWKVGRAAGRYVGRRRRYSPAEIAWLADNRTMPIGAYHRAFCVAFGRDDVTAAMLHGLRKREGWSTGRTGRFEKGQVPPNKGKRMPSHPNSAKTQFRKGNLPRNHRGPGHERIDSKDGYVILIVEETNPWSGAATRPVHKHRWLWEKANGPLPADHVLKCLDGDKLNTDPSNWEAVPRGLLPRLNGRFGRGYEEAPPELKPTILAVAKLEHRARGALKGGAQ